MATERRGGSREPQRPGSGPRGHDDAERRSGAGDRHAGSGAPAAARTRIPLPPLPPPRVAGPRVAGPRAGGPGEGGPRAAGANAAPPAPIERGLSSEESDLLAAPPEHDERTGARGVTILSDLVDEIQKGLDTEATRHAGAGLPATYRQIVACSLIVAPGVAPDAGPAVAPEISPRPDPIDRRHE